MINKEYARNYYKTYYANNVTKYKIYRISRYDSLKKYYQDYYQKNKQKIINPTYKNKNKIRPNFTKTNITTTVFFD